MATSAQKRAQKLWRERNKGNPAYLQRQARRKRMQRLRLRLPSAAPRPPPKTDACIKTLRTYSRQIEMLYQKMHGGDMLDDLAWLDDFKGVVHWLRAREKPMDTVINAVASILGRKQNKSTTYRKYSKLNVELSNAKRRKLELNELALNRMYIPKWPKIMNKIIPKIQKNDKIAASKAVCSVYTLFPPRRVMDYQEMRLNLGGSAPKDDANHLILKRRGAAQFVFNRYKTVKKYGQQIFDVPARLESVLRAYVRSNGISPDQFLFGGSKRVSDFTKFTKRAFEKEAGVGLTANDLRHSYISYVHFGPNLLSVAERKELAWKMAHSVTLQHIYAKKELAVV
jgi:hypothetical protein